MKIGIKSDEINLACNSLTFYWNTFFASWLILVQFDYLRLMTEAVVRRCSVRKGVFRNFSKFTGKHLCQ